MRVRRFRTDEEYQVVKINYLRNHPTALTEYTLDNGQTYTNGELWAEFVQIPEIHPTTPLVEDK